MNILSQVHNTHKCNEKLSLAMVQVAKAGQEMYESTLWVGLGPGLVDDLVTRLHCG